MFQPSGAARTVSRGSDKDQKYTRVLGDEEAADEGDCTEADCGMSQVHREKWKFVGLGKGDYRRKNEMLFVGDGHGNYEKEQVVTHGGSCWTVVGMILVTAAIVAIAVGYLLGALFIGRSPFQRDYTEYSCLGDVSKWLNEERDWCCARSGKGCWSTTPEPDFDCKIDQDRWDVSWSVPKKHFCCSFVAIGCQHFDCQLQLHSWRKSWPIEKRRFCCREEMLGCEACDAPCHTNGRTSSCDIHAADLLASKQVKNCSGAHVEVLRLCPSCAGCHLNGLSCHNAETEPTEKPKEKPTKEPEERPKEHSMLTEKVIHSAAALCKEPAEAGSMWAFHDGAWRQSKIHSSSEAPSIAAGPGFMWHRSADGWRQVCIPHVHGVSPPTTPAGDGFMWKQKPGLGGGMMWSQVPLRLQALDGAPPIPRDAAGVGFVYHKAADGSWLQVLAPDSLKRPQRPCARRAGLGMRWEFSTSSHGNAWQQMPVPGWRPNAHNPQPSEPAGPGFMWSYEPADHGWTQICIPGWEEQMGGAPSLQPGLGFMWKSEAPGSWEQVSIPRAFRGNCQQKPPMTGFVPAGPGFMWKCETNHQLAAWTQVHRDSKQDRRDLPPREPAGNGLMWRFERGAWQQSPIPGWTERDAPKLPAGEGLMWNRVSLGNGQKVWRQDIIPDWDVDSATHPPSEPAGEGFMWQYIDKGGRKEWTQEEIRDWYADSANHPPREYAGSGEMWKFISQKGDPGLWEQVSIPDWHTLDQFNPPTPQAGQGFMWQFDEQTGRWRQLRIQGWVNATEAQPPQVPAGVGYMWKWYKEHGENHWHQVPLRLSDLTNPHRLPSEPAGRGFRWEYNQNQGQPHWEQSLIDKPSCTGFLCSLRFW